MPSRNISRRNFLKSTVTVASLLAGSGLVRCRIDKQRIPNFIFIFADDLGWKDAGFMGSTYYETPNVDRLAAQGIVFTDAYANAPNCAPTRACLMSGQYTPRHGVFTVASSERGQSRFRKLIPVKNTTTLNPQIATFAEVLKKGGYICGHVGKWHLGEDPDSGPLAQGFDVNIGGNHRGAPASYFSPYRNKDLTDGPEGEYLTERLTDEALRFIEINKEKPFFLYLPHYAVHTPLQARNELVLKYKNKKGSAEHHHPTYAAMVESMDQSVGRIMEKLDALGLTDDTVIFFSSDNGGYGPATSMAPLRGSKGMLYEGGIRVPLVVRWPRRIPDGETCETPVMSIDFYPTILELAGLSSPHDYVLDGESLVPLLFKRGCLKREAVYWHFPAYLEAYQGDSPWRTTPAGAVRKGPWKLIEFFEDGRLELYNLAEDIGEKQNLADKRPEKAAELYNQLQQWRKKLRAPVPAQLNPMYDPTAVYTSRNS